MIRKLQRKLIMICMISVTIVLALIIAIINIVNFVDVNKQIDSRMNFVLEHSNPAKFGPVNNTNQNGDNKPPEGNMKVDLLSPEVEFDTRFFTVVLDKDGTTVIKVDTERIAAVESETAVQYAQDIASQNRKSGFYNSYKYIAKEVEDGTMYVFLDCSREMTSYYNFLLISCLVPLAGLILVFVLVIIFSRIVVKPIAESYEKQKRFITDASHEIKTPLAIINASTEVIEMENGESDWTDNIHQQISRLTGLTEKLVFLSKMDEESTKIQKIDFPLSEIAEEVASPYKAVAASQNKTFEYTIDHDMIYNGDESMFRQLMSLLLDNAMKYSNEEGNIWLTLKKTGKRINMTVDNTVDEMDQNQLPHLFDRFYRTDDSRNSETGGHGIGLSVAKAIVNAHGGTIRAYALEDKIIRFEATLPE